MKTSFLTGRAFFVSQQHNFLQKNKNSLFTQNIFHVKRESSFIIYTTVIFLFQIFSFIRGYKSAFRYRSVMLMDSMATMPPRTIST